MIPSGYGKGDVVLWDDGWWEPDPEYPDSDDPATAIAAGELKFVLVRTQAARALRDHQDVGPQRASRRRRSGC